MVSMMIVQAVAIGVGGIMVGIVFLGVVQEIGIWRRLRRLEREVRADRQVRVLAQLIRYEIAKSPRGTAAKDPVSGA